MPLKTKLEAVIIELDCSSEECLMLLPIRVACLRPSTLLFVRPVK